MEQTECSEMSAHKIQTRGHHPKEEYIITICQLQVVSTAVWCIDMVRSFQLHFQQLYLSLFLFYFILLFYFFCISVFETVILEVPNFCQHGLVYSQK